MNIPGLKHKIYIAVVGMPDCGKSTFIKKLVEHVSKRKVNVDSFCNEQQMDMTIRSAQIFLRDVKLNYDIVFLDCPGHIFEYEDEARSVLSKAHFTLRIVNAKQGDIIPYNQNYENEMQWVYHLEDLKIRALDEMILTSHSKKDDPFHYDIDELDSEKSDIIFKNIIKFIEQNNYIPVDPIETACRIIEMACNNGKNCTAMCSYGKDSVLMLQLMKMTGCLSEIKIEYPNSRFDLPGISYEFKNEIGDFFGCSIESFPVIENGWDFTNHSTQEMMLCKARMLNDRILKCNYDMCFTGIRRDEEGTRAKEKFFSPRNKDGSFDYLKPQIEIFRNEFNPELKDSFQLRVNPLLDLCEADVWYATRYFNLPFCKEYVSKDNLRYRSLGDWPITTPISSNAKTIDEICEEVDKSLIPERACRVKQDNSIEFGMEKLRKAGFF